MKYFNNVKTLDELKAEYRRLALKYHPDLGGDTEAMKAINAEHDTLFEILKVEHNRRADEDTTGKTYRTTETAEEFRDIIEHLLKLDGLDVELCGSWLWIGGDTRKHKEALKAAGCVWSKNKQKWYWHHKEDGAKYSRGRYNMEQIRDKFGSQFFKNVDPKEYASIAAAI